MSYTEKDTPGSHMNIDLRYCKPVKKETFNFADYCREYNRKCKSIIDKMKK